jgi:hypothetical protein
VHKYLYCGNNPVNNYDPSGNDIDNCSMFFVTTIGASINFSVWDYVNLTKEKEEKHTGFAYDLFGEKGNGAPGPGLNGANILKIEKGKTKVENPAGIEKFKADVADIRQKGFKIYYIQFFGHGSGTGSVGWDDKAELCFSTKYKSSQPNQLWAPDIKELFDGLVLPNVTVELHFCTSLDDQGTIDFFRGLAAQADIWGVHGMKGGWSDYGSMIWLEHYK